MLGGRKTFTQFFERVTFIGKGWVNARPARIGTVSLLAGTVLDARQLMLLISLPLSDSRHLDPHLLVFLEFGWVSAPPCHARTPTLNMDV